MPPNLIPVAIIDLPYLGYPLTPSSLYTHCIFKTLSLSQRIHPSGIGIDPFWNWELASANF